MNRLMLVTPLMILPALFLACSSYSHVIFASGPIVFKENEESMRVALVEPTHKQVIRRSVTSDGEVAFFDTQRVRLIGNESGTRTLVFPKSRNTSTALTLGSRYFAVLGSPSANRLRVIGSSPIEAQPADVRPYVAFSTNSDHIASGIGVNEVFFNTLLRGIAQRQPLVASELALILPAPEGSTTSESASPTDAKVTKVLEVARRSDVGTKNKLVLQSKLAKWRVSSAVPEFLALLDELAEDDQVDQLIDPASIDFSFQRSDDRTSAHAVDIALRSRSLSVKKMLVGAVADLSVADQRRFAQLIETEDTQLQALVVNKLSTINNEQDKRITFKFDEVTESDLLRLRELCDYWRKRLLG